MRNAYRLSSLKSIRLNRFNSFNNQLLNHYFHVTINHLILTVIILEMIQITKMDKILLVKNACRRHRDNRFKPLNNGTESRR